MPIVSSVTEASKGVVGYVGTRFIHIPWVLMIKKYLNKKWVYEHMYKCAGSQT